MRRKGVQSLYRRLGTRKRHLGHIVYPYFLGGLSIRESNRVQVVVDTPYIPMSKGFVYLT